ncbi:MAG: hypothetical protein KAG53_09925 [Endozoicomonadaceae bacterium]|nr:hypothetical protein [Endozoicomonadaceae bacterium]
MQPSTIISNQTNNNVGDHQYYDKNDEIDLLALIKIIWSYKWLTIIMCSVAIVRSVFFALNAQESWIAKSEISKPQLKNVYSFHRDIKELVVIIGEQNFHNAMISLSEPQKLFSLFVELFNMPLYKKSFFESRPEFLNYLKKHSIEKIGDDKTAENKLKRNRYRAALNDWQKYVGAINNTKLNTVSLSFKSEAQESSSQLLSAYIAYISQEVKNTLYSELLLSIDIHKNRIVTTIDMAKKIAKDKLAMEIKKAEYAYKIALSANIDNYQTGSNGEEELFHVNLGSKALKETIKSLKLLADDFIILDPEVSKHQIALDQLNHFTIT